VQAKLLENLAGGGGGTDKLGTATGRKWSIKGRAGERGQGSRGKISVKCIGGRHKKNFLRGGVRQQGVHKGKKKK